VAVAGARTLLHATAVSFSGRALLILGPSGSGKSGLALELMALGAGLIADDRTEITLREGHLVAGCPGQIRGRIEARGVGVLAAEPAPPAPVALAVDLSRSEAERLPPTRTYEILGQRIPLLHKVETRHFPAALMQYLRGGAAQ
jgi:HPr kinase/phosphorylase